MLKWSPERRKRSACKRPECAVARRLRRGLGVVGRTPASRLSSGLRSCSRAARHDGRRPHARR
eukprot:scaffold2740_cov130-Isochrysis_galbana.AAC.4